MSQIKINSITDKSGTSGPVIAGVSTNNSTGCMIIPAGPTENRGGRGRGVIGGGYNNAPNAALNSLQVITIATTGNAQDFGDLYSQRTSMGSAGNATRGLFAGGDSVPGQTDTDVISFVVMSSLGGGNQFGRLRSDRAYFSGMANNTRGVFCGGTTTPGYGAGTTRAIEDVTIATFGNSESFGSLSRPAYNVNAVSNTTRGLINIGQVTTSEGTTYDNAIEYISMQTGGSSEDFGNLVSAIKIAGAAAASSTRGLFAAGNIGSSPTITAAIDYVEIATLGDALDFGDLTVARDSIAGMSNNVRAVFAGGRTGPPASEALQDVIDFVTIASTGNASDFGDLAQATRYASGVADSHGGITQ